MAVRVKRPAVVETRLGDEVVEDQPQSGFVPFDKSYPILMQNVSDRKKIIAQELAKAKLDGVDAGTVVVLKSDRPFHRVEPTNWGIVKEVHKTYEPDAQRFNPIEVAWLHGSISRHQTDDLIVIYRHHAWSHLCEICDYQVGTA